MQLLRKAPFVLLVSAVLFASGCGGGSGSSGGGGGTTPPPPPSTANEWTWISGSNTANAKGVYGTQGVAAANNAPGSRYQAVSWIDTSGNLWLFGGLGYDSNGNQGNLNDIWEFNPASSQWTWVSGGNTAGAITVFGTLGTASTSTNPGGLSGAVGWTDSSGDLWLFGGTADDDIWEFSPTTKMWTWVSGSTPGNSFSSYGTLGVASTSNEPGTRTGAVGWTDKNGNFWLFGGNGYDSTETNGSLNDLWEYNPKAKEWTWMSGSSTVGAQLGQPGVYGTQGVPSAANVPGGRYGSVSWIDSSGNLWLFGGAGRNGPLNDLWEYSPTNKEWTWMSGGNYAGNVVGVYGTLGVAAATNVPGGRYDAVSWIDGNGNFWLLGGVGLDSTGGNYFLNDLWEFSPTEKTWTWMSGSKTAGANGGQPGVYGTLGVASASNVPGGRNGSVSWMDSSGNLWMFGGRSVDSSYNYFSDLWRYQP